jgi:predicted RNA-binding protein with PIN domain
MQPLRSSASEAKPATVEPKSNVELKIQASDLSKDKILEENEALRLKINTLVGEIENLQSDIQVMVQRQRETGTMANEALTQLEIEIEEYLRVSF